MKGPNHTVVSFDDIRLDGSVGRRLRDCFENHVARTDVVALSDHFRWR